MLVVTSGGMDNVHGDCAICGIGPCHYGCAQTEDDDYEAVLEAGALGDRDALLDYVRAGSKMVALNEERQALVIFACSRTSLLAHLPLSQEEITEAASLVESGSLMTTEAWKSSLGVKSSAALGPEGTDPPHRR